MTRGKYNSKQSTNGVVKLLDKNKEVVIIRVYDTIYKRNKYIESWKHYYGKQFKKMVIEIVPELDEGLLISELETEQILFNN